MSANPYDEYFEHAHDGIKEYDNPLPAWWTWLFVLTIFFSAYYILYYQLGVGPSIYDRYDAEVVAHLEKQLASFGELKADDATVMRLLEEKADMIAALSGMFDANCAQCHRNDGGGNIGPNLTDDHWKNVRRPADIVQVIAEGVPGTAMQSWSTRFREPQMILLAAYVASLRGTNPPNPRPPEGQVIPPWSEAVADAPPG